MSSTYTFIQKTPDPSGHNKGAGHYGNQPIDGARIAIQGIGNGPQTSDATGTPVTSPVTLSGTATTLNTPESAIQITLKNSGATNAMTISEVSGSSGNVYTLNHGEQVTMDIANTAQLFLKSASSTTCDFFYTIV